MLIDENRFDQYINYFDTKKSSRLEANKEYFSQRIADSEELSGVLVTLFEEIKKVPSVKDSNTENIAQRVRYMSLEQYCAFEYDLTNGRADLSAKYLALSPQEFDKSWKLLAPVDAARFDEYIEYLNSQSEEDLKNKQDAMHQRVDEGLLSEDILEFFTTIDKDSILRNEDNHGIALRIKKLSPEHFAAFEYELTRNSDLAARYLTVTAERFAADWKRTEKDPARLEIRSINQLAKFDDIKRDKSERGATLILGAYVGKGENANPEIGRDGSFYKQVALHLGYVSDKYPGSLSELLYYMNGDFSDPDDEQFQNIKKIGHQLPVLPEGQTDLEDIPVPENAGKRIKKYLENAARNTDKLTVYLIIANVADDPYQRVGYGFCAAPLAKLLRDLDVLPGALFDNVRIKFRCCAAGTNEYEGVTGKFAKDFAEAVKMLSGDLSDEQATVIVKAARAKNDRANVRRMVSNLETAISKSRIRLEKEHETLSSTDTSALNSAIRQQQAALQKYKNKLVPQEKDASLSQEEADTLLRITSKPPYPFYLEISVTNMPFWIEITGSAVFQIAQDNPRLYIWNELKKKFQRDYLTTFVLTDTKWMELKGRKPDVKNLMKQAMVRSSILKKWAEVPSDNFIFIKDPMKAWKGEFTAEVVGIDASTCYVVRIKKNRELLLDQKKESEELKVAAMPISLFTKGGGVGQRFSVSSGKDQRTIVLLNEPIEPQITTLVTRSPKLAAHTTAMTNEARLSAMLNVDPELIDVMVVDKNKADTNWVELAKTSEDVVRDFPKAYGVSHFIVVAADNDNVRLLQKFPPTSPEKRIISLTRSQFPEAFNNIEQPLTNKQIFNFTVNGLGEFEFVRRRPYQEVGGGSNWLQGDLWNRVYQEAQKKLPEKLIADWNKLGEAALAADTALGQWQEYLDSEEQRENEKLIPLRTMIDASRQESRMHANALQQTFDPENTEQAKTLFKIKKAMQRQIEQYTRNRLLESAVTHSRHHRNLPNQEVKSHTINPVLEQRIDRYINGENDDALRALENVARAEAVVDINGRGDIKKYILALANMGVATDANKDLGTDQISVSKDSVLFWTTFVDPYGRQEKTQHRLPGPTLLTYEFDDELDSDEKTLSLVVNCTNSGEVRDAHIVSSANSKLDDVFGPLERLSHIDPSLVDDGAIIRDPNVKRVQYGEKVELTDEQRQRMMAGEKLFFAMDGAGRLLLGTNAALLASGEAARIGGEFGYNDEERCFYISNISPYSNHKSRTESKQLQNVLPFFNQPGMKTQAYWYPRQGAGFANIYRNVFKPAFSPFTFSLDKKADEETLISISKNPFAKIIQGSEVLTVFEGVFIDENFDSVKSNYENLLSINMLYLAPADFHRYIEILQYGHELLSKSKTFSDKKEQQNLLEKTKSQLLEATKHCEENLSLLTKDCSSIEKIELWYDFLTALDAVGEKNPSYEKMKDQIAKEIGSINEEDLKSANEFHLIVIANRLGRGTVKNTRYDAGNKINDYFCLQPITNHPFKRLKDNDQYALELARYSSNHFSASLSGHQDIPVNNKTTLWSILVEAILNKNLDGLNCTHPFERIAKDISSLAFYSGKDFLRSCSLENIGTLSLACAQLSPQENCDEVLLLVANHINENKSVLENRDSLALQPLINAMTIAEKNVHLKSTKDICGDVKRLAAKAKRAKTTSFPSQERSLPKGKVSSWPVGDASGAEGRQPALDSGMIAAAETAVEDAIQTEVIDLANLRPMTPRHDEYFKRLKDAIFGADGEEIAIAESGRQIDALTREAASNKWIKYANQEEFFAWLVLENYWSSINPLEDKKNLKAIITDARKDIPIKDRPHARDNQGRFIWLSVLKTYFKYDQRRARGYWVDQLKKDQSLSKEQKIYLEKLKDMLRNIRFADINKLDSFDALEKLAISERIYQQRITWTKNVIAPRLAVAAQQAREEENARKEQALQARQEADAAASAADTQADNQPTLSPAEIREKKIYDAIIDILRMKDSHEEGLISTQIAAATRSNIDMPKFIDRLVAASEWKEFLNRWKGSLNAVSQSLSANELTNLYIVDQKNLGQVNVSLTALVKKANASASEQFDDTLRKFLSADHRSIDKKIAQLVHSVPEGGRWTLFLDATSTIASGMQIPDQSRGAMDAKATELAQWTHGRYLLGQKLVFKNDDQENTAYALAASAAKNPNQPLELPTSDYDSKTIDAMNFLVTLHQDGEMFQDAHVPPTLAQWKDRTIEKSLEIKGRISTLRKELATEYMSAIADALLRQKKARENADQIIQAIESQDDRALNATLKSVIAGNNNTPEFLQALTANKNWRAVLLAQPEAGHAIQLIQEKIELLDRIDTISEDAAEAFFSVLKDTVQRFSGEEKTDHFRMYKILQERENDLAVIPDECKATLKKMLVLLFMDGAPELGITLKKTKEKLKEYAKVDIAKWSTQRYVDMLSKGISDGQSDAKLPLLTLQHFVIGKKPEGGVSVFYQHLTALYGKSHPAMHFVAPNAAIQISFGGRDDVEEGVSDKSLVLRKRFGNKEALAIPPEANTIFFPLSDFVITSKKIQGNDVGGTQWDLLIARRLSTGGMTFDLYLSSPDGKVNERQGRLIAKCLAEIAGMTPESFANPGFLTLHRAPKLATELTSELMLIRQTQVMAQRCISNIDEAFQHISSNDIEAQSMHVLPKAVASMVGLQEQQLDVVAIVSDLITKIDSKDFNGARALMIVVAMNASTETKENFRTQLKMHYRGRIFEQYIDYVLDAGSTTNLAAGYKATRDCQQMLEQKDSKYTFKPAYENWLTQRLKDAIDNPGVLTNLDTSQFGDLSKEQTFLTNALCFGMSALIEKKEKGLALPEVGYEEIKARILTDVRSRKMELQFQLVPECLKLSCSPILDIFSALESEDLGGEGLRSAKEAFKNSVWDALSNLTAQDEQIRAIHDLSQLLIDHPQWKRLESNLAQMLPGAVLPQLFYTANDYEKYINTLRDVNISISSHAPYNQTRITSAIKSAVLKEEDLSLPINIDINDRQAELILAIKVVLTRLSPEQKEMLRQDIQFTELRRMALGLAPTLRAEARSLILKGGIDAVKSALVSKPPRIIPVPAIPAAYVLQNDQDIFSKIFLEIKNQRFCEAGLLLQEAIKDASEEEKKVFLDTLVKHTNWNAFEEVSREIFTNVLVNHSAQRPKIHQAALSNSNIKDLRPVTQKAMMPLLLNAIQGDVTSELESLKLKGKERSLVDALVYAFSKLSSEKKIPGELRKADFSTLWDKAVEILQIQEQERRLNLAETCLKNPLRDEVTLNFYSHLAGHRFAEAKALVASNTRGGIANAKSDQEKQLYVKQFASQIATHPKWKLFERTLPGYKNVREKINTLATIESQINALRDENVTVPKNLLPHLIRIINNSLAGPRFEDFREPSWPVHIRVSDDLRLLTAALCRGLRRSRPQGFKIDPQNFSQLGDFADSGLTQMQTERRTKLASDFLSNFVIAVELEPIFNAFERKDFYFAGQLVNEVFRGLTSPQKELYIDAFSQHSKWALFEEHCEFVIHGNLPTKTHSADRERREILESEFELSEEVQRWIEPILQRTIKDGVKTEIPRLSEIYPAEQRERAAKLIDAIIEGNLQLANNPDNLKVLETQKYAHARSSARSVYQSHDKIVRSKIISIFLDAKVLIPKSFFELISFFDKRDFVSAGALIKTAAFDLYPNDPTSMNVAMVIAAHPMWAVFEKAVRNSQALASIGLVIPDDLWKNIDEDESAKKVIQKELIWINRNILSQVTSDVIKAIKTGKSIQVVSSSPLTDNEKKILNQIIVALQPDPRKIGYIKPDDPSALQSLQNVAVATLGQKITINRLKIAHSALEVIQYLEMKMQPAVVATAPNVNLQKAKEAVTLMYDAIAGEDFEEAGNLIKEAAYLLSSYSSQRQMVFQELSREIASNPQLNKLVNGINDVFPDMQISSECRQVPEIEVLLTILLDEGVEIDPQHRESVMQQLKALGPGTNIEEVEWNSPLSAAEKRLAHVLFFGLILRSPDSLADISYEKLREKSKELFPDFVSSHRSKVANQFLEYAEYLAVSEQFIDVFSNALMDAKKAQALSTHIIAEINRGNFENAGSLLTGTVRQLTDEKQRNLFAMALCQHPKWGIFEKAYGNLLPGFTPEKSSQGVNEKYLEKCRNILADEEMQFDHAREKSIVNAIRLKVEKDKDMPFSEEFCELMEDAGEDDLMDATITGLKLALEMKNKNEIPEDWNYQKLRDVALQAIELVKPKAMAASIIDYVASQLQAASQTVDSFIGLVQADNPTSMVDATALLKTSLGQINSDRVNVLIDEFNRDSNWPYLNEFYAQMMIGVNEEDTLKRLERGLELLESEVVVFDEKMRGTLIPILQESIAFDEDIKLSRTLKGRLSEAQRYLLEVMGNALALSSSKYIPLTSLEALRKFSIALFKNAMVETRRQITNEYIQSIHPQRIESAITGAAHSSGQIALNPIQQSVISIASRNYEISLMERGCSEIEKENDSVALLNKHLAGFKSASDTPLSQLQARFSNDIVQLKLSEVDGELLKAAYRCFTVNMPSLPLADMPMVQKVASTKLHEERDNVSKKLLLELPKEFKGEIAGLQDVLSENVEWINLLRRQGAASAFGKQEATAADATEVLQDVEWALHYSIAVSGSSQQVDDLVERCAEEYSKREVLDEDDDVLSEQFEIKVQHRKECLQIMVPLIKDCNAKQIEWEEAGELLKVRTQKFSVSEDDETRLNALLISSLDTEMDLSNETDLDEARLHVLQKIKITKEAIDQALVSKIFRTKAQTEKFFPKLRNALLEEESWDQVYLQRDPAIRKLETTVEGLRVSLSAEAVAGYKNVRQGFNRQQKSDVAKATKLWDSTFAEKVSTENIECLAVIRDHFIANNRPLPPTDEIEKLRVEILKTEESKLAKKKAEVTDRYLHSLKVRLTPRVPNNLAKSANAQLVQQLAPSDQPIQASEQLTIGILSLVHNNAKVKMLSQEFAALDKDESICEALGNYVKRHQLVPKPSKETLDKGWALRMEALQINDNRMASLQLTFIKSYLVNRLPEIPPLRSIRDLQEYALKGYRDQGNKNVKNVMQRALAEGWIDDSFEKFHTGLKDDSRWKTILSHHSIVITSDAIKAAKQQIAALSHSINPQDQEIVRTAITTYLNVKDAKGISEGQRMWNALSQAETSIGKLSGDGLKCAEAIRDYLAKTLTSNNSIPNIEDARKKAMNENQKALPELVAVEVIAEMKAQLAAYQERQSAIDEEIRPRYGQSDPTCLREGFLHSLNVKQAEKVIELTGLTTDGWIAHLKNQFVNAVKVISPNGDSISRSDLTDKLANGEFNDAYAVSKLRRLESWMSEKEQFTPADVPDFLDDMIQQGAEMEDLRKWIKENEKSLQEACDGEFSFHELPVMYMDEEPIVKELAYSELIGKESTHGQRESKGSLMIFTTPAHALLREGKEAELYYLKAHFATRKLGHEIDSFPKESRKIKSSDDMPAIFQGFVVNNPDHPLITYARLSQGVKQFAASLGEATQTTVNPVTLQEKIMTGALETSEAKSRDVVKGVQMASIAKLQLVEDDKDRSFNQKAYDELEETLRKETSVSDDHQVMIRTSRPPYNAWVTVQPHSGEIFVHTEFEPSIDHKPQSLRAFVESGKHSQLNSINASKAVIDDRYKDDKATRDKKISEIESLSVEIVGIKGVRRKNKEMVGAHPIGALKDNVEQLSRERQILIDCFKLATGEDIKNDVLNDVLANRAENDGLSPQVWRTVFDKHTDITSLKSAAISVKGSAVAIEAVKPVRGVDVGQVNVAQIQNKIKQANSPVSILILPSPHYSAVVIKNPKSNELMIVNKNGGMESLTNFLKAIVEKNNERRKTVKLLPIKADVVAVNGIKPPSITEAKAKGKKHGRKANKGGAGG
ncbi:MAG: hypothetical protein V4568_15840 [Pseudomonadota bacterium]